MATESSWNEVATDEYGGDLVTDGAEAAAPAEETAADEGTTASQLTTTKAPDEIFTTHPTTTTTATSAIATTTAANDAELTEAPSITTPTKPPIIELPSKSTPPPYQIVTEPETTTNGTIIGPGGGSTASVAVIAGVVSTLVILFIIIVLAVFLIRRRQKRKSKQIVRMENPSYHGKPARDYRFSRDSALYVGPTVDIQSYKPDSANGSPAHRQKRSAPLPPNSSQKKKRQAPVPPNPFGDDDYYEKDSMGSMESVELSTFTAHNDNNEDAAKEPLMKNDRNGNLQTDEDNDDAELGKSSDDYDKTKNPFFDD